MGVSASINIASNVYLQPKSIVSPASGHPRTRFGNRILRSHTCKTRAHAHSHAECMRSVRLPVALAREVIHAAKSSTNTCAERKKHSRRK